MAHRCVNYLRSFGYSVKNVRGNNSNNNNKKKRWQTPRKDLNLEIFRKGKKSILGKMPTSCVELYCLKKMRGLEIKFLREKSDIYSLM